MKKVVSLLLCALLAMTVMPALPHAAAAEDASARANTEAFRLSGISDVTGANGKRVYSVYAPYTDTYSLASANASSITVFQNGKQLATGKTSVQVDLTGNEVYTLEIQTAKANTSFVMNAKALNHLITLPYDVAHPVDTSSFELNNSGADPLSPAVLNYQKRDGGTYIYSNNPEALRADAVGKALIRSEGLAGEVYFTFEHANYSGSNIYLGYQLKNEGDSDVYITVTNIGYQTSGTWFGQEAWYDFYNVAFDLPENYFSIPENQGTYAFKEYTPRVFQPVTYRLPAGEYFYVIGGTSQDAYRRISVGDTADRPVNSVACANGNVKFNVTGGSVTGTLYAYKNASQVKAEPASLGYVTGDYARQYSGRQDHAGVIDNYATWTFNDNTKDGALPVSYTNSYDVNRPWETTPYAAYNSTTHHSINVKSWTTHLNPQNNHAAVGTDMVAFVYYDAEGNPLVLDNDHADGVGKPGNFGNWMIEYQDHFTLVNQGDDPRSVTFTLEDNGALATLMRDSLTGEILRADLTAGIHVSGPNYEYTVVIPPHSVRQVTLDYVLIANSYGNVVHTAALGQAEMPDEPEVPDDPGTPDAPSTPDEPAVALPGDVNGDGKVNSVDYMLVKRYCLGTFKLTGEQKAVADVDGDGNLNAVDYMLLKRHVLGTYKVA